MGVAGPLILLLQLLLVFGIPIAVLVAGARHIRQTRAEHQEVLARLAQLEAKLDRVSSTR